MVLIKHWLGRLRCLLYGCHVYGDGYLECSYDNERMVYKYRNWCLWCGKFYEFEIPVEDLKAYDKGLDDAVSYLRYEATKNKRAEDGKRKEM